MRELLFRGKTRGKNEWVTGNFQYTIGNAPAISDRFFENGVKNSYYVRPETVSQFTGRFDVLGKMIFENHIVEEEGGHRSVVKYFDEEAKFVLESATIIADLGCNQVKIIGNIFDNPDLMA